MIKLKLLLLVLAAAILSSCSEDGSTGSTEPAQSNFSLSFAVEQSLPKLAVETIELTSVKILIRSLKLNAANENDVNVRTDPFVVELDLNGSLNSVAVGSVPDQSYDKIKFEIHKPAELETPPDPVFAENEERYSVIVEGLSDGETFTYKSSTSAHQIIHLYNTANLDENGMLNITLTVNPYDWFTSNGVYLDPMFEKNRVDIDRLIKDSFHKAFRDMNRDGVPD